MQGSVKEKKNNINFFSCFLFLYTLLVVVSFLFSFYLCSSTDKERWKVKVIQKMRKAALTSLVHQMKRIITARKVKTDSFTFRKIHEEK